MRRPCTRRSCATASWATGTGREALELIEEMDRDCQTMAGMVGQARAAAKGDESLRRNVINELTVTSGRTGAAMVSAPNDETARGDPEDRGQQRARDDAVRFFMEKRDSGDEARAREGAVGFTDVLNDAVRRVEVAHTRVDGTFRKVRGRVPKAMARDEGFLTIIGWP